VRLLEVSDGFLTAGEVWPVTFGESPEYPFKSTVILASRGDYERILSREIALPEEFGAPERGRRVWPA